MAEDGRPPRIWLRSALAAVAAALAAIGFNVWRGAYDASPPPPGSLRASLPPPQTFAKVFTPCAHCHQIGPGAHIATGPPLTGVVGRTAASWPGYPYSQAMRDSHIVWDRATLAKFIAHPQDVVPGTRMQFAGLPPDEIGRLVDFIASIPGNG